MKKFFVLLLTSLIVLTLSACGNESNDTPTVDITSASSIADLAGARIGAQQNTFHAEAANQIENVQKTELPDFTDLLVALKSKTIDGYIAEEPTALSECGKDDSITYIKLVNNTTGFAAEESDTGVAIGLVKGSDLREEMNEILTALDSDTQRELMSQIIDITLGKQVNSFVLESEVPSNPTGVLKVGMECAYEPYNWTETEASSLGAVKIANDDTGLYANGYDVQVAQYVANKLGLTLEVYAYDWDSLIPALQAGTLDAIVAGMSPTAARWETIDFTDCYYNSNLVVIINK